MVDTTAEVLPDARHTANDVKAETDANRVSFDTIVWTTSIGFDNQSVGSEDSDGTLDYDHVARIAACQDVIIGVHYYEQLIDRIHANWDEELATTHEPGPWATDPPHT
jgi:hypothetical protein